jgi:predicted ATPase
MDQGAHFHSCDFQVHTPRDNNWVGECPADEGQRCAYAGEFISACRSKGLEAVAITDHHDIAYFPYIRDAAFSEKDGNGAPIPAERRIIVFPGFELTLALPCQAILLFDPDTGMEDLNRALASLGITPGPPESQKALPVTRLTINNLNEISVRLSAHPNLKDKFILLPNVNDGGDDTLLRTGFFEHYKNMTCVGGYVDGSFSGHGRKQIVEGKDPAWGNRRIGVIQTSDSRQRDFSTLGVHRTWIKWSVPTTEAIRQACLAPSSRIRYASPLLPDNLIASVEVSNSKFFGPFTEEFNPQLNTIIGGRGSGKSTILEYIRWALCDQAYVYHEDEGTELPDYERRRASLVGSTLRSSHGNVTINYIRHGVVHLIRREAETGKVYLRVADQAEQETKEEIIQSLAQIQGYSQKQLSHVSVRSSELERLLTLPIAQELSSLDTQVQTEASNLKQAFERVESHRLLQAQLQSIELDLASKREQLKSLSDQVRDLPDEQQKEIVAHPLYAEGERLATAYSSSIDSVSDVLSSSQSSIEKVLSDLPAAEKARPLDQLSAIRNAVSLRFKQVVEQLQSLAASVDSLRGDIKETVESITLEIAAHRKKYDAAASENLVIQESLTSLRTISDQIAEAEKGRDLLLRNIEAVSGAQTHLAESRTRWREGIDKRTALLDQQAAVLTKDSSGELRASIQRGKNVDRIKTAMQDAIKGAAITTPEKFDKLLDEVISSPNPLAAWLEVGEELIALARVGPQLPVGANLPATPRIAAAGFIPSEIKRIASKLKPSSAFDLTLNYPESVPIFDYRTNDGTYVPFQEASPGQQATALIGLLMSQSAGPLVVDQPEDDLDNSTILKVAERLWNAKEKRQIIFSTHNPNLAVIGDAELVLHCAYQQPVQGAKVEVADRGAIDNRKVCEILANVMEGGEEAFVLRKEKYGF